tara:strand:+ start:1686 stop:2360 length:675 start_codon:yes stop_codon:yes gene_type:complete
MNVFLSAGPGTASQTLVSQLNNQKNFKNKFPINFKKGNGTGHFKIVCSGSKLKKIKIAEKFNIDLLFYQHLLPTDKNLNLLFQIINPDKTFFIFTKRNIFDTSLHFKSRYFNNEPVPFVNQIKKNYRESIYNTILFYSYWLKIIDRPYLRIITVNYKEIINNNKVLEKKLCQFLDLDIKLNKNIKNNLSISKKKHKLNKSDLHFIKKTIKKFKCEDILKKFELI